MTICLSVKIIQILVADFEIKPRQPKTCQLLTHIKNYNKYIFCEKYKSFSCFLRYCIFYEKSLIFVKHDSDHLKHFDENAVLLHYKQWSHNQFWLPMPTNISSQMVTQPQYTIKEILNLPSSYPSSPKQSPKKKKQYMTCWTSTCGQ